MNVEKTNGQKKKKNTISLSQYNQPYNVPAPPAMASDRYRLIYEPA